MRTLLIPVLALGLMSTARCDTLTYQIEVDKTTYVVGETVNWTVSVNASEFAVDNFGLAGAQASLTEDRGETLSGATFVAPVSSYNLVLAGIGGAGSLDFFSANENVGNSGNVIETTEDAIFTPLATGAFTATMLGDHTLTVVPDNSALANAFFTENDGGGFDPRTDYSTLVGDSVNFSVTAVPEPSSLLLTAVGLGLIGCTRRRRNG